MAVLAVFRSPCLMPVCKFEIYPKPSQTLIMFLRSLSESAVFEKTAHGGPEKRFRVGLGKGAPASKLAVVVGWRLAVWCEKLVGGCLEQHLW